jgi:outer membrane protein OmpA-like peptidoglycan-associated protein
MRYFQSLLFLFFCGTVFGQLDGAWQGILIQENPDKTTTNFAIWVDIKTNGTQLTGSFRSEQANSPYFKVSKITGNINGSNVVFEEKIILSHNTQSGMSWCFLLANFVYNESEQKLNGTYRSEGCLPGELVLIKANKRFNYGATEVAESSSLAVVEKLLSDKKTVVGKQFVLTDVNFQSGKHNLAPSSYAYLNKIIRLLKENGLLKIHLKGHTDGDGDDEGNFLLSQKRAKSVSYYMINGGVDEARITFEGYGESRSIASNQSKEGKRINRRVELLIISD